VCVSVCSYRSIIDGLTGLPPACLRGHAAAAAAAAAAAERMRRCMLLLTVWLGQESVADSSVV